MAPSIDSSIGARRRLAVLSGHFASASGDVPAIVDSSMASANVQPAGNLSGSLLVVDQRTGKKFEFKISEEGTVKATDFKKGMTKSMIIKDRIIGVKMKKVMTNQV